MIKIKPQIDHQAHCPHCGGKLLPMDILWQGIHVCVESQCGSCHEIIIGDLPVGHAAFAPYQANLKKNLLFGDKDSKAWFGEPLLKSLKTPMDNSEVELKVEVFFKSNRVIILNCIDFLYGHSLLKLLNAEAHMKNNAELGLIVIVPFFLRWMVPHGVAEIWVVNIPLSKSQNYYPQLDKLIKKECTRFDEIYASYAHSHPKYFDITKFTRIEKHDAREDNFRVTFIWREDRPWWSHNFSLRVLNKLKLKVICLCWQNFKIVHLFTKLRKEYPNVKFTVTGLGSATSFPSWIDDRRVKRFSDELEKQTCSIYSESRLVMGVHGSNMLLPSAHAGMTIDLMPDDRWGNIVQDILYQINDNRLASFTYRYLPINIKKSILKKIIVFQIENYFDYRKKMIT